MIFTFVGRRLGTRFFRSTTAQDAPGGRPRESRPQNLEAWGGLWRGTRSQIPRTFDKDVGQGELQKDKDKDTWTGTRMPNPARRSPKGRRNGISMILWSGTAVLWAGPAILEAGTAVLWVRTAVLWTGTAVLEAARIDARCF